MIKAGYSFIWIVTILLGVLMLNAVVDTFWTEKVVDGFEEETLSAKDDCEGNGNLRRRLTDCNTQDDSCSVYTERLEDANLSLSVKQQRKFHENKHSIADHFPRDKRYRANVDQYAAIPISDEFAYM
jgi:hypothetical protein